MFKKGIIVTGHGNLGKTTLIKAIYNELIRKNAHEVYIHNYPKEDFIAIVEYDGKKVLIISGGDYPLILEKAFDKLKEDGYSRNKLYSDIDCVVGAARSHGGTHDFWEKEITSPIIWVSKSHFKKNIINNTNILAAIYVGLI